MTETDEHQDDVADVVRQLYGAYNRHDVTAVGALYSSGGIHDDVAIGHPHQGGVAIGNGLRSFLSAFPDARWETLDQIHDGDRVAVRYELTATLQQNFGPYSAAGQLLRLRGVQVLDTQQGLIERSEDFWDSATFHRQMNNPTGENQ